MSKSWLPGLLGLSRHHEGGSGTDGMQMPADATARPRSASGRAERRVEPAIGQRQRVAVQLLHEPAVEARVGLEFDRHANPTTACGT